MIKGKDREKLEDYLIQSWDPSMNPNVIIDIINPDFNHIKDPLERIQTIKRSSKIDLILESRGNKILDLLDQLESWYSEHPVQQPEYNRRYAPIHSPNPLFSGK